MQLDLSMTQRGTAHRRAVVMHSDVDLLASMCAIFGTRSAYEGGDVKLDIVSLETDIWGSRERVKPRGYLFTCRYAVPELIERGGGAIVDSTFQVPVGLA